MSKIEIIEIVNSDKPYVKQEGNKKKNLILKRKK